MTGQALANRVLVAACGSVAVLNLHEYLLALRSGLRCDLRLLLTASAGRFVRAEALRLFCGDVISSGEGPALQPNHADLADWADLLLVLPATANILSDAACGRAGSLLSATIVAARRPVVFFPSMSLAMWENPAVARNVATVRADGHVVVAPVEQRAYQAARQATGMSATLPSPAHTVKIVAELAAQGSGEQALDSPAGEVSDPGRGQCQ